MKAFKTFIAIVSSILLVFSLFIGVITINGIGFFKERNINNILNDVSFTDFIKDDYNIWYQIKEIANEYGASEEALYGIFDGNNIKELLSKYFASMFDSDNDIMEIKQEDISEAVSKDIDAYNKKNNKLISNDSKALILNSIEYNYEEIKKYIPTKEKIESLFYDHEVEQIKSFINILKENHFVNYLILTTVLLIVFIFICKYKEYKFLKYYGVSFFITGVVVIGIGVLMLLNNELINELDAPKPFYDLLITIKNNIASNLNITAFILIVISIFLFFLKKELSLHSNQFLESIELKSSGASKKKNNIYENEE